MTTSTIATISKNTAPTTFQSISAVAVVKKHTSKIILMSISGPLGSQVSPIWSKRPNKGQLPVDELGQKVKERMLEIEAERAKEDEEDEEEELEEEELKATGGPK